MEHFSSFVLFGVTMMLLGSLFPVSTLAEDLPEPEEMKMEVVKKPKFCLRKVKAGDIMLMKMEGKIFSTGEVFDSNLKAKQPYIFQHRGGQLDEQMETAMEDMCAGETRKIILPGGGRRQNFTTKNGFEVSANATLEYVVELQEIQESPDHVMVFNLLNTDKSGKLSVAQFMAIAAQGLEMFPMVSTLEQMEMVIQEAFRLADKDGDGRLDLEEYLDSPLVSKANPEHEDALEKLFAKMDKMEKQATAESETPKKEEL
ncbi:peptidyl-prolyl cis-trans isomerase FKBP14-like [Pecten maximus]|uniref:peptidyl-prolyl cis-trans isomerase FKBP14-like n=1 Tax=Pecten maximus TaxID=6579 RepID=UPI0014589E0A|nr:peptidyl-prolyl cis-trans isomerase FKBP14-like [Pecten maximus]